MKKWLSLVAGVVLCLVLVIGAACGGGGGEEEEAGVKELKIGIGEPLTGALGAVVGIPCRNAFSMAAEKIGVFTVGGEQYRWKVIFEDNLANVEGGVSSTNKFIYEHHVDFIHQTSGYPGLAAQPLCEGSGVLLDIGCVLMEAFGPEHPYTLQAGPCWIQQVAALFDWLTKEHPEITRVTVSASNAPISAPFNEAYETTADYFGLELEMVPYAAETIEYYPVANNMMTYDPECVIAGVELLDYMWDMGYEGLTIGGYCSENTFDRYCGSGWDRCKGYIIYEPHTLGMEEKWPEAAAFRDEYEARYGYEITPSAFWACCVIYTITGALEHAGTVGDLDAIVEAFRTGTFDTLVGPLYYGGEALCGVNHMAMWPCPIIEVVGDHEYRVLAYYTAEEAEAIANEAYQPK